MAKFGINAKSDFTQLITVSETHGSPQGTLICPLEEAKGEKVCLYPYFIERLSPKEAQYVLRENYIC